MKSKKNLIITIIVFALILGVSVFLYQALKDTEKQGGLSSSEEKKDSKKESGSDKPSTSLPDAMDFTVQDEDGNTVTFSNLFGKPIVLNFWNSNCPPCRQEMPDFEEVHKENPDVQFVMVDTVGMNGETLESGKTYIQETGFTFPVYYDVDMEAIHAYSIRAFPTTYLINSEGKIEAYGEGMLDKETLINALASIK